jgi:hypothetical protein
LSLPSGVNWAVVLDAEGAPSDAFCAANTPLFRVFLTTPLVAAAATTIVNIHTRFVIGVSS